MIKKIYRNGYEFQIDPERLFLRFIGGGGGSGAPSVRPNPPMPVASDKTEDFTTARLRRRSGYEKTILTGELAPGGEGKKATLE